MSNYNTNTTNANKTSTTTHTGYDHKTNINTNNISHQKYGHNTENKIISQKKKDNKTYINKDNKPHHKTMIVAYLLWLFLFGLGAHRFYTKNTTSALVVLVLTIVGFIMFFYYPSISFVILAILTIWFVVDAFLTYKNVNDYNEITDSKIV